MANPKDLMGQAKPNLSIVPLRPLYEAALALYEGARKYGKWNWRKEKVDEVIYVDAAIRHLNQWLSGEDIDPDSGLSHISKAIAGLLVLRDAQVHGTSIDTRSETQNVDFEDLKKRILAINEKHPNPVEYENPLAEGDNSAPVRFELTAAGGGSYVISAADIGNEVELRDGYKAIIDNVDDDHPYNVDLVDGNGSCLDYVTDRGFSSETEELSPRDIVKVLN